MKNVPCPLPPPPPQKKNTAKWGNLNWNESKLQRMIWLPRCDMIRKIGEETTFPIVNLVVVLE